GFRGGDSGGRNSSTCEELPELDWSVGSGQECRKQITGDAAKGVFGRATDRRIRIARQEHEDCELLVCARRERALSRQHANIVHRFSSLEEIEQRRRSHYCDGGGRYSLKFAKFTRAVTTCPALPSGRAAAPLTVILTAAASPAVNTSSRRMSSVSCSSGR